MKKDKEVKDEKINKRNTALDIIRIVALFCVVSVHFFLNNGFYLQPVLGERMYIMTVMRTGFMICVPLFMILTGYLMNKKKLSKQYYFGLVKTLAIYVLASIACFLFRFFYLKHPFTISKFFLSILDFSLDGYSWYIEMYIGLFLLIPFLNLIYHNLEDKKQKKTLLITMLFLTSIPSITNIFNFKEPFGFRTFFNNNALEVSKILPFRWSGIYPITYYFIGCYLKEYKLNLKWWLSILFLIINVVFFGTFNYLVNRNDTFYWGIYQDYGALPNVISAVLVFNFIANINFNTLPLTLRKFLAKISDCCLGGYLVSYIFDNTFYPILIDKVEPMTMRLNYYIVIVPFIFICSVSLSYILNMIYKIISKLFYFIKSKFTKAPIT